MEGGRVIESGSHGELMALGATYAQLYALRAEEDMSVEAATDGAEANADIDPASDPVTDPLPPGARTARARA
jgi:hypothetical protein